MKKLCMLLAFLLCLPLAAVSAEETASPPYLFFDDFETEDVSRWTVENGEAQFIKEGSNTVYRVTSTDYFEKDTMENLRNYAYSFDMKIDYRDEDGAFGTTWPAFQYRSRDGIYYNMYFYNKVGFEEIGAEKNVGENTWMDVAKVPLTEDNCEWVKVRVELTGNDVKVYYKDMETPVISFTETESPSPTGGSFCFVNGRASEFLIDNLRVEETHPVHKDCEPITKDTSREPFLFQDYEMVSAGPESGWCSAGEMLAEENGNTCLSLAAPMETEQEFENFVLRYQLKNNYQPYGVMKPSLAFGNGFRLEFDSNLSAPQLTLSYNGAVLASARAILADDDGEWVSVGITTHENEIYIYYHNLAEPLLTTAAEEPVSASSLLFEGGMLDNLYIGSYYRQKPVAVNEFTVDAADGTLTAKAYVTSSLEADMKATAVLAGYQNDTLCGWNASQVRLKGNALDGTTPQQTEIQIEMPEIPDAQYILYLFDSLAPLSDAAFSGQEPVRIPMSADSHEDTEITLNAQCSGNSAEISGLLSGNTDQSIVLLAVGVGKERLVMADNLVFLKQFAKPEADGSFHAKITMTDEMEEGPYFIYAITDDQTMATANYEYLKPSNLSAFLEKINACTDGAGMRSLLLAAENERYALRFGIDLERFRALNSELLETGVCTQVLLQKGDGFTAETIGPVFSERLAMAMLKQCGGGNAIVQALEDNPDLYPLPENAAQLYAQQTETIQNEACNGLYEGLKKDRYPTVSDVLADLRPNIILASLYCANYKDIPALLNEYESELEISLSKLNRLSTEQKKNKALQQMNSERCYTFAEFQALYDSAIKSAEDGGSGGGGSGSGGGGGGGFGGGNSSTVAVVSPSPSPKPEEPQPEADFSDVPQGHWAFDAVRYLTRENTVLTGYGDGTFLPDRAVTRAEFAKLVVSAFSFDTDETDCRFEDVSENDWFCPYVAAAKRYGITGGVSDTQFAPQENISRQDMAVMLYRAASAKLMPLTGKNQPDFTDWESVAEYARTAVQTLSSAGIINGTETGEFLPQATATRAQAAKMIYEILKQ